MKYWLTLIVMILLVACAANPDRTALTGNSAAMENSKMDKFLDKSSGRLIKSPHGYVIDGPKGRFGGFLGDCTSDENFQYYWMCQDENAGNGGFR